MSGRSRKRSAESEAPTLSEDEFLGQLAKSNKLSESVDKSGSKVVQSTVKGLEEKVSK